MRRIVLLCLLLIPTLAFSAIDLGYKKATENIRFKIYCLDTLGRNAIICDSCQIITTLDTATTGSGNQKAFTASITTVFNSTQIDSMIYGADTTLYFFDQIQDIDGTPGHTVYDLLIEVKAWEQGYSFDNTAIVHVLPDSVDVYWVNNFDTVKAIIDSLQLLDEKYTLIRDTLQNQDNQFVALRDTLDIALDSIRAALDSLQLLDEKYTLIRDTLQNQDNQFIALRDTLDIALDSIRAALDSLQLLDEKFTALRDSINLVHAEIDTELDNIVEAFDNDANAAPGLELTDIRVTPASGDTGIVVRGNGSYGVWVKGGTNFFGWHVEGTGTAAAVNFSGGATNGSGLRLEGFGSGASFAMVPGASGGHITLAARQELASTNTDSIWQANLNDRDNVAGSFADSAGGWGATGAGALDSSFHSRLLHRVVWGTSKSAGSDSSTQAERDVTATASIADSIAAMVPDLRALAALGGLSGREQDSTRLVRYFSLSGDDSDGKSWATAWSSMSKLNAFWKKLDTAVNYDGMNMVFVSADSFNFGGTAACSVFADNTWLIGAGEKTFGRPSSIWYKMVVQGASSTASDDSDLIRIYGNNVHILNMTLCAFDTVGDPDPGSGTGGNNAITFDSTTNGGAIVGGEVAYCYFPPPNHKPLQANARGGSDVASGLWWHHNIFLQPSIHAMDGFMKNSFIEDNLIAGRAPDHGTGVGAAAIQLLGTGSTTNNHNTVRRNEIFNFDVGIALINTDSNMVLDNIINRVVTAPWSITSGYNSNMFDGNRVNVEYPVIDYGLIGNGGFEQWKGTLYTPFDWMGGNGTAGSGVRSEVHYDIPHTGGWAYLLAGSTSGSATDGNLDSKLLHLAPGRYQWSAWMRPDAFNAIAYDTLGTTLFKDKVGGDSTVTTWLNYAQTATDTVYGTWSKIGQSFTVNSEANYYLRFWARGKTSSPSNTVFVDDIQVFPHAGDSIKFVLKADTANQLTETITVGSISFVDSIGKNLTEQGGIAGATITWTVYAVDSTGTPATVPGTFITVKDGSGNPKLSAVTNSSGYATFTVTSGTWNLSGMGGVAGSYIFVARNKTVSANQTDTLKGYDVSPAVPSGPNMCTVYGTIRHNGSPVKRAKLVFNMNINTKNSCDSTTTYTAPIETWTNPDGYFEQALVKSQCFNNAEYKVTVYSNDVIIIPEHSFRVPDSTTYLLWWQ